MGFDIYGLKPKENTKKPHILTEEWEVLDKEQKDLYWKIEEKYDKENPGIYFRNNVWYWRALWTYVCNICEDVMTTEDMKAGDSNSGYEISESTVDNMLSKLMVELALQNHLKYEELYNKELEDLPNEKCSLCKGTGKRNDEYVKGECNGCKGEGDRRPWSTSYNFEHKNVEEFVAFLAESGGIKIL